MKPAFILYSISYTGTHFVKQFFSKLGYQIYNTRHYNEQSFIQYHIPWDDEMLYELPIIIPLRDPMMCLKSNLNRGTVLNTSTSDLRFIKFISDWTYLINIIDKINYKFIKIDCTLEDRYTELIEAAEFIGFNYDKNIVKNYANKWIPLNESNPSNELTYDLTEIPLMNPILEWYEGVTS